MAVVVTGVALWDDGKVLHGVASLVLSGTYPLPPGEPFDFKVGPFTRGAGKLGFDRIPYTQQQPLRVDVNGVSGFVYTYDSVAKTFRVWVNTAGGVNAPLGEHTNVAYVAGVLADIITCKFEIPKA